MCFLDQILLFNYCSDEIWHKVSFEGKLANLLIWLAILDFVKILYQPIGTK